MKTRKGNVFLTLALAGFLAFGSPSPSANAAWKTTPNGKIYTQTKAPGYLTGMKKIGSNWYYFNKNGIMQTGFHTLANGATYYFNANGTRRTGWLSLTSGGTAQRYYFDENGIMATGIQTIDKVMYYFSPKGVMRPAGYRCRQKDPFIMQTRPVLWLSPAGLEAITSTLTESWPPIPGSKENMSARTAKRPVRHAITAGSQKAVLLIIMTQREIR